jgi:hypothetical protein
MATEMSLTGNKMIKSVRKEFTRKFNYLHIRFYTDDNKIVDDKSTIASVRKKTGSGELSIVGNLTAGSLEKRCNEMYGFNVEVMLAKKAGRGYSTFKTEKMHDAMTLSQLNGWAKDNGYADMSEWAEEL